MTSAIKFNKLYHKKYHSLHLLVILLLTLMTLIRVYSLSFIIGWDDQMYVLNHFTEDGLYSVNVYDIFTQFFHGQYAPINQLYYSALFELFDYNTVVFHLGSLIIHIANSFLVYYLTYLLASAFFGANNRKNAQIGCLTAILFAIAPINLEAVAWVAASKVPLYALFYFSALLAYIKYIDSARTGYYYLTVLLFIVSFGAKEQAVTLPVAMLTIDFIYRRNFRDLILWLEKLPMLALALTFALASLQSQGGGTMVIASYYPLPDRFLLSLYTIIEYLTKTLLPINLSYVYPYPFMVGQAPPFWMWIYPIVLPVIVYCLWNKFSNKWLLWGLLFFLVHIVLVSNIINLSRFSAVADRYAYVSTVGIYFILSVYFIDVLHAFNRRMLSVGIAVVMLFYFSSYTAIHLTVWQNGNTLKHHVSEVIQSRPDFESWKNRTLSKHHEN